VGKIKPIILTKIGEQHVGNIDYFNCALCAKPFFRKVGVCFTEHEAIG